MNKTKPSIWIYCRVSNKEDAELLKYQRNVMIKSLTPKDCKIIGITFDTCKGVDPNTKKIELLKEYIRNQQIQYIYVYDYSRLFIHKDMFMEFQMYCNKYNVKILSYVDDNKPFR